MTSIEQYAMEGMQMVRSGNDGDPAYVTFRKMYLALTNDPSILKRVTDYRLVGQGLSMLLSYGTISDIDTLQMLSSVSYLMTSHAIKLNDNINLHKDRVHVIMQYKEPFGYTVSSAINPNMSIMDFHWRMGFADFDKRRAINQMELYDLMVGGGAVARFHKIFHDELLSIHHDLTEGFMRDTPDPAENFEKGKEMHEKIYQYLYTKVFDEEDIDF